MRDYMLRLIILTVTIIAITTNLLFAEDRVREGTKDLARGIAALPSDIATTANESNIINGVFVGTAKGILNTAKGIGEGVFKILTFYNPKAA